MINLEVPGEEVQPKIKENLLRHLQNMFEQNVADYVFNPKRFFGSHPVSFTRDHFSGFSDYLVCEKSDGVRYLLFLPEIPNIRGVNDCQGFLIDRKNTFWRITLLLPASVLKGHSLFDVELVLDHGTDRRILVFDTLFVCGVCFMHNNYWDRLQAAWYNLVYPIRESKIKSKRGIDIYLKDFFRPNQIDFLWNHICPNLPHKCDGLIFTAVGGEYVFGSNQFIVKWKPSEMNTLDFYVKHTNRGVYDLCTLSGRNHEKFAEMEIGELPEIKEGTIIECFLEREKWRVYKVRSDKSSENTTETAQRVLKSIRDNVSIEEIIQHFFVIKKK